jgi:hypothetical protein
MAGEGSLCERGLHPLSFSLPRSNIRNNQLKQILLFERGSGGEHIKSTKTKETEKGGVDKELLLC